MANHLFRRVKVAFGSLVRKIQKKKADGKVKKEGEKEEEKQPNEQPTNAEKKKPNILSSIFMGSSPSSLPSYCHFNSISSSNLPDLVFSSPSSSEAIISSSSSFVPPSSFSPSHIKNGCRLLPEVSLASLILPPVAADHHLNYTPPMAMASFSLSRSPSVESVISLFVARLF